MSAPSFPVEPLPDSNVDSPSNCHAYLRDSSETNDCISISAGVGGQQLPCKDVACMRLNEENAMLM